MNDAPSITLQGSHAIDGRKLFDGITLTLPAAEWTCLLGPSGVGKSTILRLILGLDTAGTFTGSIEASDAQPLENRISYMAQSDLLLPWLTVLENTVLGARLRDEKPDLDRAQTLLARVGLSEHQTKKPAALSGGMRQRAALARTLMEDRPIVLLDEPFSALDAGTRADMQELAAEVLTDKTVMLVTHDPGEAARMAYQIVLLTPSEAKQWPVPPIPPTRPVDAPETLSAQSELLAHMRGFRA